MSVCECEDDDLVGGNSVIEEVCEVDVDGHLAQISQLLPQGRAWPRDPDSTLMKFWKSFAEVVKYLEDRTCDLSNEFFCDTATETLDTWAEQYDINPPIAIDYTNPCIKPEYLVDPLLNDPAVLYSEEICGRVAAQGGGTCEYFVEVALSLGWVVSCEDPHKDFNYPYVGCMQSGCVQLGPPPELVGANSCLDYGQLSTCDYGYAWEHPEPEYWEASSPQFKANCKVPGSDLGKGGLCCAHVGYYDFEKEEAEAAPTYCGVTNKISLPEYCATDKLSFTACDQSSKYKEYTGHQHHIKFTVDTQATLDLQASLSAYEPHWVVGGCFSCGNTCNPLRTLNRDQLTEFLDKIIPAHTIATIIFD